MEGLGVLSAFSLLLAFLFLRAVHSHFHSECYTVNGEDYRGRQNQTSLVGGKPCLFWNETFEHPYNTLKYSNGEKGLGPHNYCRNPDGDVRPWCYIAEHEDGIYWRFCEIPSCQMPGILGCFKDNGQPPPLAESYQTSQTLTIQNCISFCRKQRYKLAGMESGYACFCGNDLDYDVHLPTLECSHVCFGNQQQPCGGDGHIIVFHTRVGACGGNYTSQSAVIYSPDFPDNYSPGRVCYWTIQVPGASSILFNFTYFSITDQADLVEILDGYTNLVVARFDGRNPPREVVNFTADFAILYFYSDRTNEAQGFSMIYQAFQPHRRAEEEEEEGDGGQGVVSTVEPWSVSSSSSTERFNISFNQKSSSIFVITSSPDKPPHSPVWTIYALVALLTLTVIAMVAKLLLHITVKNPFIPSVSESCSQRSVPEPWIIFYRPSTISLFKNKLKNHHGDLNPLVQN
ncbi:kremen protein 1-like [Hoplias malabaricus]|uniref:kremen protein 1-like n=1 Tax=Hoplias malabaricus TaxID=27720 RepID=UPI0034629A71